MVQKVLSKSWLAENPKGEEQAHYALSVTDPSLPANPDGSPARIQVGFTGDTWATALQVGQFLASDRDEGLEPARSQLAEKVVNNLLDELSEPMAAAGIDPETSTNEDVYAWFDAQQQAERVNTDWQTFPSTVSFVIDDERHEVKVEVHAPGVLHAVSAVDELGQRLADGRISLTPIAVAACTDGGAGAERGYGADDPDEDPDAVIILD